MDIGTLMQLATVDFLNHMLARHHQTSRPVIAEASAQIADMPYLDNGRSRNAWFVTLEVTPAEDAEVALPSRLVLKAGRNTAGQAAQELFFYQLARNAKLPIARCFGTGWLEDEEIALLLMESVRADFFYYGCDSNHLAHYHQAFRSLAQLHAWRWNHPTLGTAQLEYRWNTEFLDNIMALVHTGFNQLKASGTGIDPPALSLIEGIQKQLPSLLFARVADGGPMCINHGDAGLWNFMFISDPQAPAIMLDFPQWCVNPPAWDLVCMMSLNWPTDFRRAHEPSLLATYKNTLSQFGIAYDSATFDRDMKLCALGMTSVVMVSLATGVRSVEEAATEIHRALAVLEDYDATELLE